MGIIIYNSKDVEKLKLFVKAAARRAGADTYLCAIGSVQSDYRGVRHSYSQALKLWNLKKECSGIFFYEDAAAELLLHDVSPE